MKIGILTFHHSRNYGAVLQAYGLKEVLCELNHHVNVIDYRNIAIDKRKRLFTFKRLINNPLRFIKQFLNIYISYKKRINNFTRFEKKELNLTDRRFQPKDIQESNYEAIIIGSDQVWSPIITDGPDPVYWGAFRPKYSLLIAYAVSSNRIETLETKDFVDVREWLERFDSISVRESRLKDYVETHSSKKAEIVIDPTLLAGREPFERIAAPRIFKRPYILLYHVETTPSLVSIAKKVATLYGAEIICIGTKGLSRFFTHKTGIRYYNASVEELLSLIKYSECVVALSFHGTALSLLFEKDFYSVKGNNMARVEAVLKECNLMNRVVENESDVIKEQINYADTKVQLAAMRQRSLAWLRNALHE